MADIKPVAIGTLSKGNYVVIEGSPCKVVDVQVSRPGKHGHAKVRLTGGGLIDGKKRIIVAPGHDHVDVPIVEKKTAQVLSLSQGQDTEGNPKKIANVMDSITYETFDMDVPKELEGEVVEGVSVVYWEIMDSKVIKQVKTDG